MATSDSATADPMVSPEQEVKFRVSDAFTIPDLGGKGLRHIAAGTRMLDAVYWDTTDLRLARRGHSVRYRASDDGSEGKWTLKLATGDRSALLQRREVDFEGDATEPPASLVDALAGITGERPLLAVMRLRSNRDSHGVDDIDGHRLLTVDDDRVDVIERGRLVGSLREVEVELADEDHGRGALARATRRLRNAGAGEPDPTPKLQLALGDTARPYPAVILHRHSTVADLARATVRDGLDQLLLHDPGVRLNLGPEDMHQARVATRRLRANLRTLRPLFDRRAVDQLRDEVGRAGRLLGAVRDLDVLHETFAAVAEQSDLDAAPLIAVLGRERADAFRDLVDSMRGTRWRSMLEALEAAAVLPPLGINVSPMGDARPAVRRLFRKTWRRLEQRVALATREPSGWHEVRKAAKSVRYAAELLEPLLKSGAPAVAKNAERIQARLGEVQDRVVARSWLLAHANDESIGDVSQELIRHFGERSATKPRHWNRMWKQARRSAAPLTGGSR